MISKFFSFGGKSQTSSVSGEKETESHVSESSGSKAGTPEAPEPYSPAKKTIKKGVLEDVYPWIKLLPARSTPDAELEEGYEVGDDEDNGTEGEAIDTRGMAPKNIDDRGRIRGGCVDCDCDEFERSPKGAQCHYCHCSPSAHEQLWPPPPEENQPPPEGPAEETETAEDPVTESEGEAPKSSGPIGTFIANFKKKIKPKNTEDEMEAAKREELEEIRKQMEEEVEAFEKKKRKEFEKLKEVWSEMYFKSLPQERCSADKRGILRGRCRDCDCDGFESDLPASSSCAYCGCAPTYHVAKVDYFSEQPLVIYNDRYVNKEAMKNWKRSEFAGEKEDATTVEEEQDEERSRSSSFIESQEEEYGEKSKTAVTEIYPWIKDKSKKKKLRNTGEIRENRRTGQQSSVQEMTEEIRKLRAEIDDVLFYDNEDSLQTVLQQMWADHHKLVHRFEEFMGEDEADIAATTPE